MICFLLILFCVFTALCFLLTFVLLLAVSRRRVTQFILSYDYYNSVSTHTHTHTCGHLCLGLLSLINLAYVLFLFFYYYYFATTNSSFTLYCFEFCFVAPEQYGMGHCCRLKRNGNVWARAHKHTHIDEHAFTWARTHTAYICISMGGNYAHTTKQIFYRFSEIPRN